MSDRPVALGSVSRECVAQVFRAVFEQALKDWGAMLGIAGVVKDTNVRVLPYSHELVRRMTVGGAFVRTRIESRMGGPLIVVLPPALVGNLLAVALMLPHSSANTPKVDWTNAGHVDAVREIVNLMCGSATRALEETGTRTRVSQAVEQLSVHEHYEGAGVAEGITRAACVRIDLEIEGTACSAWCVLPEEVAALMRIVRT